MKKVSMYFDVAKKYIDIFGKGAIIEMAPSIAQGFVSGLFKERNVTVVSIDNDIRNNRSLSKEISQEHIDKLKQLAHHLGSLDFITPELFIDSIKEEFPSVASLFMGDEIAYAWLVTQVDEFKRLTE